MFRFDQLIRRDMIVRDVKQRHPETIPVFEYLRCHPSCDDCDIETVARKNGHNLLDVVEALNQAVRGAPREVSIGVHVCRGNYKGMYLSEGGYDSVAERFFGRTRANHFLLEFDTPRAGGFAPLRWVPQDKGVVLGLVSSKSAQLEEVDLLRRRVDEAARFVDPSRLAISPQCGFASTMGGNPVTEAVQWSKLSRCVEAARAIWG